MIHWHGRQKYCLEYLSPIKEVTYRFSMVILKRLIYSMLPRFLRTIAEKIGYDCQTGCAQKKEEENLWSLVNNSSLFGQACGT